MVYFNNIRGLPAALTGGDAYRHNIYWLPARRVLSPVSKKKGLGIYLR